MTGTGADKLAEILKRYLNHIVYIDDEFKISWNTREHDEEKPPRRSSRKYAGSQAEQDDSAVLESNLEAFCKIVRREYPEILLTPVVYEEPMDIENLVIHMKQARMLILDWSLSERVTAVKLLKRAEFFGQLRFCVIYTSKLDDAKREFINEIPNVKRDGLKRGECRGKEYEYVRADSVIYLICEKDKFDFHMIMSSLTEIFIQEIGYFPVAFLDMVARLEEKVPYYLNQFSCPFDKLLMLQINSDGLPMNDVYHTMNDMVVNNIRADINLDESVLDGIFENQIYLLKQLSGDEERFQERLYKSLDIISDRLECPESERALLKEIPLEHYKKVIEKAVLNPRDLSKGLHSASEMLAKQYGIQKAERLIAESGAADGNAGIKKELSRLYRQQFRQKAEKIFPACLMILTNPDESYQINRLITSLKIVNYKDGDNVFPEIFRDCYTQEEEYMCLKTEAGRPKLGLLQNKLNSGDILYKREGGIEKCYLCIVPSCHILRPKKVDGNILFVEGRIVSEKPDRNLKDSEHFTILPGVEDENKLMRVIWQYHKIVSLDLNRILCSDFENLRRPYKLTYEYVRQIMGEFVAFYSKSGVEELFLKADSSLEHLLLRR